MVLWKARTFLEGKLRPKSSKKGEALLILSPYYS